MNEEELQKKKITIIVGLIVASILIGIIWRVVMHYI